MLKAYGYDSADSENLIELAKVSICADAGIFRKLGKFFLRCAEEIETMPSGDWDHVHFFDTKEGHNIIGVDLAAAKLLEINKVWPPQKS